MKNAKTSRPQKPRVLATSDANRLNLILNAALSKQGCTVYTTQFDDGSHALSLFAADMMFDSRPAFELAMHRGRPHLRHHRLAVHHRLFTHYLEQVSRDLEFAPHIRELNKMVFNHLFRKYCQHPLMSKTETGKYVFELFNDFLVDVRSCLASDGVQRKLASWQRSGKESEKDLRKYIDSLFADHFSLDVIHLKFGYCRAEFDDADIPSIVSPIASMHENDMACASGDHVHMKFEVPTRVLFDEVQKDRERLFKNLTNKIQLSRDMVGYVCFMEWSRIEGFYLRCIFLYSTEATRDVDTATLDEQAGEYWSDNVTEGRGNYRNLNIAGHFQNVRGCIERDARERRTRFVDELTSPCRIAQYVKISHAKGAKLMTKGQATGSAKKSPKPSKGDGTTRTATLPRT